MFWKPKANINVRCLVCVVRSPAPRKNAWLRALTFPRNAKPRASEIWNSRQIFLCVRRTRQTWLTLRMHARAWAKDCIMWYAKAWWEFLGEWLIFSMQPVLFKFIYLSESFFRHRGCSELEKNSFEFRNIILGSQIENSNWFFQQVSFMQWSCNTYELFMY